MQEERPFIASLGTLFDKLLSVIFKDALVACPGCNPAFAHDSWDGLQQSPTTLSAGVNGWIFKAGRQDVIILFL